MHIPVLLEEVMNFLKPENGGNFIDATFGEGNFSFEIVKRARGKDKKASILAFEFDPELYKIGLQRIRTLGFERNIILINANFRYIKRHAKKRSFTFVNGVVFDLGIATWHYESSKRGFSFSADEFLDMRINPERIKITAYEIVNFSPYEKLYEIFEKYGEEKEAKRVAKAIIEARKKKRITSAKELAEIVEKAKKRKKRKLHKATQVFMALRIFINNELENLEEGIKQAYELLDKHGKLCVISFHGLEDKIIKKVFRELKREKGAEIITKNVIRPGKEEIARNPRARSARLRVIEKV